MSLWKIAWRSIQQRALSSTLTGFSMSLGVALVVSVLVIHAKVQDSFDRTAAGYELLVGAKGGAYELVLNSVYYLGKPVGNVPYAYYREFLSADPQSGRPAGKLSKGVKYAIPICLGDSFTRNDRQFRIVATVPDFFDKLEYARGTHYEFAAGRNFRQENFFEAVIGSVVAAQTGLKVGDDFNPEHGVPEEAGLNHEHDPFTVVGVLAPTGTPTDSALYINVEGFYLMPEHARSEPVASKPAGAKAPAVKETDAGEPVSKDHDHARASEGRKEPAYEGDRDEGHASEKHDEHAHEDRQEAEHAHEEHAHEEHAHEEHAHEEHAHEEHAHEEHDHAHSPLPESRREVSAVLIKFQPNAGLVAMGLTQNINRDVVAQAVSPLAVVTMMRDNFIGPLQVLLLVLACLVIVVSAVGVMVSIYNTMNERRREIAILRALGAGRGKVMAIVLCESVLLSMAGCLAGIVLGHGAIAALNPFLVPRTGVAIGFFEFSWAEWQVIPALAALSALAGYVPALTAYRTDVAKALSASP